MIGTLTTWGSPGSGIPRYEREVVFHISPERFVELEARGAARYVECGTVHARLDVPGGRSFVHSITVEEEIGEELASVPASL